MERKDHGVPFKGPIVFDHIAFGVDSSEEAWQLKDKLEAAGFECSDVIVQDPESNDNRFDNAVAVYEVSEDTLVFVPPLLKDLRHLWSPNDLSVLAIGEIYLTNDYRNMTDLIFKRKRSEVAYYNPGTRIWSVATSGLGLANGILAGENQVYVSTTTENTGQKITNNCSIGEPGKQNQQTNIHR